jgi:hypothetical protein
MGVYGKLLNKHYTPPQQQTQPPERPQSPGKKDVEKAAAPEDRKTPLPTPLPYENSQPQEQPNTPDTMIPRYHDTNVDTTIPSNHDTTVPQTEDEMLEAVRKAVKQIGKEPATQRLTLEEKQALRAIEFTYAQQGITTSGNEIIRVGMNFIVKDYQKNGENSILAKVLKRLNF